MIIHDHSQLVGQRGHAIATTADPNPSPRSGDSREQYVSCPHCLKRLNRVLAVQNVDHRGLVALGTEDAANGYRLVLVESVYTRSDASQVRWNSKFIEGLDHSRRDGFRADCVGHN